ncbi:hypothetical protein A3E97_03165 [Candidatus Uhrbacteria bacterium RIFCSPHIGHO2_12_FULL_47_12]|uniref:DUF948 domain-containing protein n=1 Tax=Candidatus Uhrbacteria bacterium RIFCSPLOWO2_02_FULL_48_18 TaxID=1802408 RepID=A0A1F7V7D8_9BACT|nr:MAG: hypothetical protein A3E97_03165 [Candidatus Uhrbacteria bacterium RIFCSPHIGHO2_12_FULL_47_12]OGL82562.1 MAG: hypothetical protein A3B20_00345 [Candidatus Uhrbacteria bacterium RIFCSPLOWO2_01_FULL_47_17]OGL86496.1 MAG: hypothetical protein A3I41_04355 [Candidatus Uhrbacteria bacterium RIFCSPLOWO2_02_FULL_48_18]OGL93129.1 MAG: hypothetical protein A3H12_01595 [Candidatus Uhrbacteria bacterium RIFCSPLOWO2_12_FULL_47_9]
MSFSPLDILYIVLSFCVLWFTAAMFWFLWQLATILKNVNDTIADARDKMNKIEQALSGIRAKFDSASSLVGLGANTAAKAVEYVMEKKKKMEREMKEENEMEPPSRKPAFKKKKRK